MVSVLEVTEIHGLPVNTQKVSLIKETPSDYLMRKFELKGYCVEVLSYVQYLWYEVRPRPISIEDRNCAFYWILHHYGFTDITEEFEGDIYFSDHVDVLIQEAYVVFERNY